MADDSTAVAAHTYQDIPLDQLEVAEANVRRRELAADIDQLAHSMATFGLQQPIVVQPKGNRYEILIGQRRFSAAKQLGWESLPAKVLTEALDPIEAKIVSFSENVQRRDLAPKDKADVCRYLLDRLGSVRRVAEHIGVSEATVRKWIGYAAVPETIKTMVAAGQLSVPTATRISQAVADDSQALAVAQRIAELAPPKPQRDRILDALEEAPERPVEVILERANDAKFTTEVIFVLPQRWAEAIGKAAEDAGLEPSDIAKTATIEWLQERRY